MYGECHAKHILNDDNLKNDISDSFELVNVLYGSGKIDNFLEILEVFTFKDDDVFFLGGSIQEISSPYNTFMLKVQKLSNIIFTKYKNSKIVFWNMTSRPEHPTYSRILEINKAKEEFNNNNNFFVETINLFPEDFEDNTHLNKLGKVNFINQIREIILKHKESLKAPRFEKLETSQVMEFGKNESVIFILDYKKIKPAEINVEYHDDKISVFNHHYGVNVVPYRKNILKLKNLKKITFDDNIIPLECQIQYY